MNSDAPASTGGTGGIGGSGVSGSAPWRRLALMTLGLGVLLALSIGFAVSFGAAQVPLWQRLLLGGVWSEAQEAILFALRLPRVLTAAALGGLLGVAGVAFQALLRNPLADPYVLGVSGGASLGGVLALIAGVAGLGVPLAAFVGALASLVAIERMATTGGRLTVFTLLLTGAIFNAFSAALIYFLQSVASREELSAIVFYLMGRVPSSGLGHPGRALGGRRRDHRRALRLGARLQRPHRRRGGRAAARSGRRTPEAANFRARFARHGARGRDRRPDRLRRPGGAASAPPAARSRPPPAAAGRVPRRSVLSGAGRPRGADPRRADRVAGGRRDGAPRRAVLPDPPAPPRSGIGRGGGPHG